LRAFFTRHAPLLLTASWIPIHDKENTMATESITRTITLELDFATVEQINWLREHGRFESNKEVVEAGIQALSRNYERLEDERRYRAELASQTRFRPHDLG
jgi:Arc/MetJ-type ribon-helix-helix transcriptional regulator